MRRPPSTQSTQFATDSDGWIGRPSSPKVTSQFYPPCRLTWTLKMTPWKTVCSFPMTVLRVHVVRPAGGFGWSGPLYFKKALWCPQHCSWIWRLCKGLRKVLRSRTTRAALDDGSETFPPWQPVPVIQPSPHEVVRRTCREAF